MKTLATACLFGAIATCATNAVIAETADEVLDLKHRIIEIQNSGKLGFNNLTLCSEVSSFCSYTPLQSPEVPANGTLLLYYEPRNLSTSLITGVYKIHFTQDVILLDKTGGTVIFRQDEMLKFDYSTTSPVLDVFATNRLTLTGLAPGEYIFKAILHDKIKASSAETIVKFRVAGGGSTGGQ